MKPLIKRVSLQMLSMLFHDHHGKIVFYHDIHKEKSYAPVSTSISSFRKHVEIARSNGFVFVNRTPISDKEIQVCLDDGFRGVWEARNDFAQEGIYPTISLAIDLIGTAGYLTWDEIKELQQGGYTFTSHTWSHRSLTDVPMRELDHELRDARNYLSDKLGKSIDQLCFPRGRFSSMILRKCIEAGYRVFHTSLPGSCQTDLRLLLGLDRHELLSQNSILPRTLVQGLDETDFLSTLNGAYAALVRRYIKQHYIHS